MAAVICLRRTINAAEYLPVLPGTPAKGEAPDAESGSFASNEQRERFLALWNRRWNDVAQCSMLKWHPWKMRSATLGPQ